MVILRLVGTAAGERTPFDHKYVKEYDPTFCPPGEDYDGGILQVTDDPGEALHFATVGEALEKWKQPYGIREDGELNRPLTAWSVEFINVEGK